jgi:catechol-2,3-dioxygenase
MEDTMTRIVTHVRESSAPVTAHGFLEQVADKLVADAVELRQIARAALRDTSPEAELRAWAHALGYRLWHRDGTYFVNHGGSHHHTGGLSLDEVAAWLATAPPAPDDCPDGFADRRPAA